jgi:hypothetical protein
MPGHATTAFWLRRWRHIRPAGDGAAGIGGPAFWRRRSTMARPGILRRDHHSAWTAAPSWTIPVHGNVHRRGEAERHHRPELPPSDWPIATRPSGRIRQNLHVVHRLAQTSARTVVSMACTPVAVGRTGRSVLERRFPGCAAPEPSTRCVDAPPRPGAPLFGRRSQVSWPYIPRELEEVPAGLRIFGQEPPDRPSALGCVAAPASGHYVAPRPVSAAHPRLDVVDAEVGRLEDPAAIDAAVPVAVEDLPAIHARLTWPLSNSWTSLIAPGACRTSSRASGPRKRGHAARRATTHAQSPREPPHVTFQ